MVLIVAGSFLAIAVLYQVGDWWLSSRPQQAPAAAYYDPYEWELVMYKNGEVTGPRCKTRIISESSTRLGLEYDYDRGKGRIRLQSSDGGQNWQGTWETSAGTGNVLLKMNPEKDSLRGRWWNSDSQKKEDREGGPLHIMKQ